jgi:hypothetical protein
MGHGTLSVTSRVSPVARSIRQGAGRSCLVACASLSVRAGAAPRCYAPDRRTASIWNLIAGGPAHHRIDRWPPPDRPRQPPRAARLSRRPPPPAAPARRASCRCAKRTSRTEVIASPMSRSRFSVLLNNAPGKHARRTAESGSLVSTSAAGSFRPRTSDDRSASPQHDADAQMSARLSTNAAPCSGLM